MKVAFLTLGCKVNFYETEQMMEQFQSMMEMMKLLETMQDFSGGENNDEQSESGFRKSTEWITEPEQNLMDE